MICSEGYTSSLAARSLQELGLKNSTDVIGGYKAVSELVVCEEVIFSCFVALLSR